MRRKAYRLQALQKKKGPGRERAHPGHERGMIMPFEKISQHIRHLEHDLYFLMDFISENGMWQEAKEHLAEHEDDIIPFGCAHAYAWEDGSR